MYRIKRPETQQIVIRYHPWIQRCIGLLFIVAGFSVAYFVFPTLVTLHCERTKDICTLERSSLFRSGSTEIPLREMTRARLETVESPGTEDIRKVTFRIWIDTRRGSLPFTRYSIGQWKNEKADIVARVNSYLENPSENTLDIEDDERSRFYLLSAGLVCFGLLPLCFVRTVTCRLDKAGDGFYLTGGGLWGFKREERRLSDLAEATVSTAGKGGSAMCRIVFRFVSGKSIPLTYYRYPDSLRMREVVKEINRFLGK